MSVFSLSDTKPLLPREIAAGMITQAQQGSVVSRLSGADPMRFGNVDYLVFNDVPKAEFVEENGEKSSTSGSFTSVTAVPHKAQVTMRFSEEVKWADEDYQLGALQTLASSGSTALARALDFGVIHAINPLTGSKIPGWTNNITTTPKVITGDSKTDVDDQFRNAVGMLIKNPKPIAVTGAAFDSSFAWDLASLKTKDGSGATSQLRYPQLGFGTDITSFMGLPTAQSNTVSGRPEAQDTGVRAIVGDWANGLRWGVQRNIPVTLIDRGDPDGQGDLARKNQIALRLEIVYGWYAFVDHFAIVTTPAAPKPSGSGS
ncbi:phage major capsid family protein [Cutibacterium granulosum]|jgi:phage capsid family|uniref:phage major capsid family protein n=1 Tax=Cutibacterium granulosum TaxID=33011 RepID=UPI002573DD8A|nr:phage major capsid protein [Cutibacterium granulosum]MEA5635823.1 phage major capsid protein [Cutibacterium granulosum]MEA5642515.1 phage major capsid protein [Cutibacterium granulosum]BDQ41025.1 hypothetical protein TPCG7_16740 [Cutibacterium granulosum]